MINTYHFTSVSDQINDIFIIVQFTHRQESVELCYFLLSSPNIPTCHPTKSDCLKGNWFTNMKEKEMSSNTTGKQIPIKHKNTEEKVDWKRWHRCGFRESLHADKEASGRKFLTSIRKAAVIKGWKPIRGSDAGINLHIKERISWHWKLARNWSKFKNMAIHLVMEEIFNSIL